MFRALLLLLLVGGIASAQIDALRAEIRDAYLKQPSLDLIRARDFFIEVKSRPNVAQYVEALRAELEVRSNPSRMRADACSRLLYLSDTRENRELAAKVLARSSLREVGITPYYALARKLSDQNVDTSLAAFQLLEQPDVRMNWISPFAFDQAELVASLLLPIDEKYWVDAAIERLPSTEDETAQKTLLHLLWYGQSDFADSQLAAFAKDKKKSAASRTLAGELLAREPSLSALDRTEVLAATEAELRARRETRQRGLYFRNIMPYMERDTMKILLKRRLASARN
jgi:hypothetical protein